MGTYAEKPYQPWRDPYFPGPFVSVVPEGSVTAFPDPKLAPRPVRPQTAVSVAPRGSQEATAPADRVRRPVKRTSPSRTPAARHAEYLRRKARQEQP